jgi:hypothetical protein
MDSSRWNRICRAMIAFTYHLNSSASSRPQHASASCTVPDDRCLHPFSDSQRHSSGDSARRGVVRLVGRWSRTPPRRAPSPMTAASARSPFRSAAAPGTPRDGGTGRPVGRWSRRWMKAEALEAFYTCDRAGRWGDGEGIRSPCGGYSVLS